jgi:putative heme-binding domain-containing protein
MIAGLLADNPRRRGYHPDCEPLYSRKPEGVDVTRIELSCRRTLLLWLLCCFVSVTAVPAADLPQVPDGFTVELVADQTLVQHPMMGSLDERGRLFIAESAGTNRRSSELIADPLDKILMLEDVDGDGVFDKSTVFADKMVFPQGCLWYRGALYTCSSPYLWKLEDTDDDGVCDRRTVLVKSFGFSGNAADIHGPFLGPDGRVYWCDGRHGHEIRDQGEGEFGGEDTVLDTPPDPEPGLPNPDGSLLTRGKAARIFSCRPDGSDVQVLCGGGMDNPVEVDFWETGECIGTVNLFYGRPRGDCIVHWVKGGVYPRFDQQACIDEFPWTGGLLGPVHNYGHVAVAGITRYRSNQFFPDSDQASGGRQPTVSASDAGSTPNQGADDPRSPPDRATFFVTQFNTHKVVKTTLERDGASFRHVSTDDFLVSSDPDFHPTDVIEDADGSLLVINTGGWFRIGCPTSQIAKPEIAGAIYRIRRNGAHHIDDPRGRDLQLAELSPQELVTFFDDPRPVVREYAIDTFSRLDFQKLTDSESRFVVEGPFLDPGLSERARRNWWWALSRADQAATEYLAFGDQAESVRLVAARLNAISRLRRPDSGYNSALRDGDPALKRAVADWLAASYQRSRSGGSVADALLQTVPEAGNDLVLAHAIQHALIEIGDSESAAKHLHDDNPKVRRAALIALDQMEGGNLTREQVLPLLDTDDADLQETVLTVISRREGWAAATVDLLQRWISETQLTVQRAAILRSFMTAQAGDPDIQKLIADSLQDANVPVATRVVLLEIAERAAVDQFPDAWDTMLQTLLQDEAPAIRLQAIRTIRSHNRTVFDDDLLALAEDPTAAPDLRIEAFATVAPRLEAAPDGVFADLLALLAGDADVVDKLRIARALADAPLSEAQLVQVADALDAIGPTATPVLLKAFENSHSENVGRRFVAGLESQGDSLRVSSAELARILAAYPPSVQDQAGKLLERLGANLEQQAAKLEQLLPLTEEGDPNVGHYLFFGEKASCSRCHRIGDQGAQIAPDLSKIASIRQARDLLEAVVFPSASFARGYRPYTILTLDGRVESGLISRETSDELILRTTDLREIRIARKNIEEMAESTTSIMPQGLDTRLSRDELRDLLAYLQTLK